MILCPEPPSARKNVETPYPALRAGQARLKAVPFVQERFRNLFSPNIAPRAGFTSLHGTCILAGLYRLKSPLGCWAIRTVDQNPL